VPERPGDIISLKLFEQRKTMTTHELNECQPNDFRCAVKPASLDDGVKFLSQFVW
jgi:hypothetical protein